MSILNFSLNILGYNVIGLEVSVSFVLWFLLSSIIRDWLHSRKKLCR